MVQTLALVDKLLLLGSCLGFVSGAFLSNLKSTGDRYCGYNSMLASVGGDRTECPSNSTHRDLNRLSNEALYFLHNSGFESLPKEDADLVGELISTKVRNKRRFRQRKEEAQGRSEDEITSKLIRSWWVKMIGSDDNIDFDVPSI